MLNILFKIKWKNFKLSPHHFQVITGQHAEKFKGVKTYARHCIIIIPYLQDHNQ